MHWSFGDEDTPTRLGLSCLFFKIKLPFVYGKILLQSNINLPDYMFLLKSLKLANCRSTGKKKVISSL